MSQAGLEVTVAEVDLEVLVLLPPPPSVPPHQASAGG